MQPFKADPTIKEVDRYNDFALQIVLLSHNLTKNNFSMKMKCFLIHHPSHILLVYSFFFMSGHNAAGSCEKRGKIIEQEDEWA